MTETPQTPAEYYKKATSFWNYPEIPYGSALRRMILPTDIVADIGCGIGIVSRYLAPFCQKVVAIDQDETPLKVLRDDLCQLEVNNIEVIHAHWPEVYIDDWDVAVSFYHYHFGFTSPEIQTLLSKTRRCGIMVSQGLRSREGFYEELGRVFDLPKHAESCVGSCYVRGRLEQAGFRVTCEESFHDFGQPVDSKEEAANYVIKQLRLQEHQRSQLEAIILNYVEDVDGQMVLPIKRYNCMLRFYK